MGDRSDLERARLARIAADTADLVGRVFAEQEETLLAMAGAIERTLRAGGTVFFCGNGGSAADAQHLAAELLVRFRSRVERRSLPGLALTFDPTTLTAAGNDYGFEQVFARPLMGLARPGDTLVGLTTSGRSANVIEALKVARDAGLACLGLLGGNGGPTAILCDHAIIVPSDETARVQEVHITVGHAVIELVEDRLLIT